MSARALAIAVALAAAGAQAAEAFEFEELDTKIPTHFVSLQTGVNLGMLELSLQSGHFVAGVSGSPGWALATDGRFVVLDTRFGYTWALSPPGETMWFFDLVADVTPGRVANGGTSGPFIDPHLGLFGAFGISLGFRYVHHSGLTLGFRLPLLGLSFGDWIDRQYMGTWNLGASLLGWYMALGLSSSLFTLGLRF